MSAQPTATPQLEGNQFQSLFFSVIFGLAGASTGLFAAYSYYHDMIRPFAHALTVWIFLAIVASARRRPREAMLRTVSGLVGAVIAFYVGKPIFYGVYYPNVPPLDVNTRDLVVWCILALLAGLALGFFFSQIGDASWRGAVATAAAVGLMLAATFVEVAPRLTRQEVPLIAFSILSAIIVFVFADNTKTQLKRTFALVLPVFLVSLSIVIAPDALERILLNM